MNRLADLNIIHLYIYIQEERSYLDIYKLDNQIYFASKSDIWDHIYRMFDWYRFIQIIRQYNCIKEDFLYFQNIKSSYLYSLCKKNTFLNSKIHTYEYYFKLFRNFHPSKGKWERLIYDLHFQNKLSNSQRSPHMFYTYSYKDNRVAQIKISFNL
jgi:hypothetical protein